MPEEVTLDQKIQKLEAENRKLKEQMINLQMQNATAGFNNTMTSIGREIQHQQELEEEAKAMGWVVTGVGVGCLAIGVGLGALFFGNED